MPAIADRDTGRSPGAASPRHRPRTFEYVFPAIRGVQAGREYFVTMCPLRLIPRLFMFDDEELAPELRAQRNLNKARVPEIARYVLDNPDSYVFSALTASVDGDVRFEPYGDSGTDKRMGALIVPMSARFVINDGQHRRAGIQRAVAQNPALGDESIAIVLFLDRGLARCQQMFADLNRYAIRPARSISVLYDRRDEISAITRLTVFRVPLLRDLTETERSSLSARSRKLFTLSAFYVANKALFDDNSASPLERRVDSATGYWHAVADQFPEWGQVYQRQLSAGEVRRDFVHSHGVVLHALGRIGNTLTGGGSKTTGWARVLGKLQGLDWRRDSPAWEGRATVGGRVSKTSASVLLTTAAIRTALGLPLPAVEQQAEDAFRRGET